MRRTWIVLLGVVLSLVACSPPGSSGISDAGQLRHVVGGTPFATGSANSHGRSVVRVSGTVIDPSWVALEVLVATQQRVDANWRVVCRSGGRTLRLADHRSGELRAAGFPVALPIARHLDRCTVSAVVVGREGGRMEVGLY